MSRKYDIDRTDIELLNIIAEEGDISNRELASRVGLTPPPTLERMKSLVSKGVVLGYRANIDYSYFGYRHSLMVTITIPSANATEAEDLMMRARHVMRVEQLDPGTLQGGVHKYSVTIVGRSEAHAEGIVKFLVKDMPYAMVDANRIIKTVKDCGIILEESDLVR